MMRYILIVVFIWTFGVTASGQRTAQFESTMYFEDARGNRDSIIFGMDTSANKIFNPDFGEIDINSPYDSVFEVRAAHAGLHVNRQVNDPDGDIVYSKKIISNANDYSENDNCPWAGDGIAFTVRAKYLPVSITWNASDFNTSPCRVASHLSNHFGFYNFANWWEIEGFAETYVCTGEYSEYSTDFPLPTGWHIQTQEDIVGSTTDTVYGLMLAIGWLNGIGPCRQDVVASKDVQKDVSPLLFPNPTSGKVLFADLSHTEYIVFDSQGKYLENGEGNQIDLSDYSTGIFFIKYKIKDHYRTERIVKVE